MDTLCFFNFSSLRAYSADYKLVRFFLFFPENRIWHFMQIVSIGDKSCLKCQILFSGKNKKRYFKMSSAQNFTQSGKR